MGKLKVLKPRLTKMAPRIATPREIRDKPYSPDATVRGWYHSARWQALRFQVLTVIAKILAFSEGSESQRGVHSIRSSSLLPIVIGSAVGLKVAKLIGPGSAVQEKSTGSGCSIE